MDEKSVDTVWHLSLFYKFRKNGVSDKFYNFLKNMYVHTEVCVKTDDNKLINFFQSYVGVRQGNHFSPNLFKLFINDLPDIFSKECDPDNLNSIDINCLMYADDVFLISVTHEGVRN